MLAALQQQIVEWLAADEDFAGPPIVEVLSERQADLVSRYEIELKNRLGLCLVVGVPVVTSDGDDRHSVRADIPVHCWENVLLNMSPTGRRMPAADAALSAYGALVDRVPPGGWSPLVFRRLALGDASPNGILMYELIVSTGVRLRTTRVA